MNQMTIAAEIIASSDKLTESAGVEYLKKNPINTNKVNWINGRLNMDDEQEDEWLHPGM